MTRWIKPSTRMPTEPGLYRVLAELDDGTIEEQVDGWSAREWFSGTSGLPGTIIAWSEEETTELDSEVRLLRGQRDTARADLAATRRALEELTRGRRLEMSLDEVVDMYRREEER